MEANRLPRVNPAFELPEAAGSLAAVLEDLIIPYAFGGAVAQNVWETAGAIPEIEVLVSVPGARVNELREAVRDAGFEIHDYEELRQALRAAGLDGRELRNLRDLREDRLNKLSEHVKQVLATVQAYRISARKRRGPATSRSLFTLTKGFMRAQLYLPNVPIQHSILRRAVRLPIGGRGVWVMTAEDLIVLQTLSRCQKDLLDARAILGAQRDRLDLAYLRDWAARMLDKESMAEVEGWIGQSASGGAAPTAPPSD